MIDFWFFQFIERTENYSTRMAQKAVVIVSGQHITVKWTLLISSCKIRLHRAKNVQSKKLGVVQLLF